MMCPIFYESFCGAFFKKRLIASPRPLTCSPLRSQQQPQRVIRNDGFVRFLQAMQISYLDASSIATATVIPTMGLLPAPMSPIIST